MVEITCPWCESRLALPDEREADAQTCAECLTTWSYEETADGELPLAA